MRKAGFLVTLLFVLGVWVFAEAANPPKDVTIYDIQTLNGVVLGDSVRIRDVIITGIDTRPTTYGFWVQEQGGGIYSGILCYTGSAFPTGLNRGDIMTVKGVYAEYPYGYDTSNAASEINSYYPWYWERTGCATVPNPVLLSCSHLGYWPADAPKAERWEGVLIKVDTVRVVGLTYLARSYIIAEAHAHAGATIADTVCVRNDKMDPNAPQAPSVGDTLLSITGVLNFEYGRYELCPRDGDDIIPLHSPPPHLLRAYTTSNTSIDAVFDTRLEKTSAEDIQNYSLGSEMAITGASLDPVGEQTVTLTTITQIPGTYETLTACCIRSKGGTLMPAPQDYSFRDGVCPISMVQTPKSAENDSSQYAGDEVTVAGIVAGDKTVFTTEFFVENTPGGPWSGIVIYGGIPAPVAQGDSVIVAGFASEYYGETEITPVHYLRIVSSGNPIPEPDWVLPSQVNTGSSTAESYEGVFVRVDPVFVADTTGWQGWGEWHVCDSRYPADLLTVGHSGQYTYVPRPGRWIGICGLMHYVYGNFRIEPRANADIDTVWTCLGCEDVGTQPKPPVFALEQNSPNPFNPVTNIFFSIPEKAKVELYVCDVSGRVVKRLVDGVAMGPGRHKATWDGRNDVGKAVSSGVYFCNLVAADKVGQMKMVILK